MAKKTVKPFAHLAGDPKTITVEEASVWVQQNLRAGAVCPVCTQLAKKYKRKLSSNMAYVLILIHRAFRKQSDWLHVPEYLAKLGETGATIRGGDWAKLVHWGLIVAKDDGELRKDGSKRIGFYKETPLGVSFVDGKAQVPRYAFIFAQRCLGHSEETTTIREALGNRFNYGEMMAG